MKATIITHQGWADHFSCNGLVHYYSKKFDELTLFAANNELAVMLSEMYSDEPNIKVSVPQFVSIARSSEDTCIKCHTQGSSSGCPRGVGECQYIDYSKYTHATNLKIGAFKGYSNWSGYLRNSNKSFAHCFYEFENLSADLRIDEFRISKTKQLEIPMLPYTVVHDDSNRGIRLNDRIDGEIFQLNQVSRIMIDTVDIIENASEIKMIDSNYSVMIYLLSFHNQKISKIPKYLYASTRNNRDTGIYELPTPEQWRKL